MFSWTPNEFKAKIPEDENGEGMPRLAYCLTVLAAQNATHRLLLGSRNVVLEEVNMNADLRA